MQFRMNDGETLTAVCAGAKTTVNPVVGIESVSTQGQASTYVSLNGVTAVTLFTGTAGYAPLVAGLTLCNTDTGAITVTFKHVTTAITFTITFTLAIGDVLTINAAGVAVRDVNGQAKTANAATVSTVLAGPLTHLVGASTIALGTNAATAAALPAGTAGIYPVTAADDTVGVILNVADQVSGRTIKISNLVSNKILKVYAPTGGTINGAAANAAFSSVSGKDILISCISGAGNTWSAG